MAEHDCIELYTPVLTPRREGPELVEISEDGAKALPGTGFDPDSEQHWRGCDAVRYAIALQQMRDDKDFKSLDRAKAWVQQFYIVLQERDGTRLVSFMIDKKQGRSGKYRLALKMPVVDAVLYDAATPGVVRYSISVSVHRDKGYLQKRAREALGE